MPCWHTDFFQKFGTIEDPRQPCGPCTCSLRVLLILGLSWASYMPLAGSVQPAQLIVWVLPIYAPDRTNRVHLWVLVSMWPKHQDANGLHICIWRQHSRGDFVWTSLGLHVDFSLTTEVLRHVAPYAEDSCMDCTTNCTVMILSFRTPKTFVVITLKVWTMWLYHTLMSPNDADRMTNSVDPDQTASLGAVWSGSALFAQDYLSENLGSLWLSTRPTYWNPLPNQHLNHSLVCCPTWQNHWSRAKCWPSDSIHFNCSLYRH